VVKQKYSKLADRYNMLCFVLYLLEKRSVIFLPFKSKFLKNKSLVLEDRSKLLSSEYKPGTESCPFIVLTTLLWLQ